MTEKRYKCHPGAVGVHIGVGTDEHELTGDECRDLLNALHEENQSIRQTIQDMMENERTHIGYNVLKQLWEAIQ